MQDKTRGFGRMHIAGRTGGNFSRAIRNRGRAQGSSAEVGRRGEKKKTAPRDGAST